MRTIVFGVTMIGWLGCNVVEQSEPTPDRWTSVSQSNQAADPLPVRVPQSDFTGCLAGQTCAFANGCNGVSNNVPCGVNKVCCTPSGNQFCSDGQGMCIDAPRCPGDLNNLGACSTTALCCPLPE